MRVVDYVRPGICAVMLMLLGTYIYLNQIKLDVFARQWTEFTQGAPAAPMARIVIGGKMLWEKPLVSTGYYGKDPRKQIHYLMLDQALMQKLLNAEDEIQIFLGQREPVKPQFDRQAQIVRADLPLHRLYFVSEHQTETLARAILSESRGSRNNIHCLPEALCRSLRITSPEWGPVEGPYLRTDESIMRRGLPRGRWLMGPKTTLSLRSSRPQRVVMLMNLYGLLPDQQITVTGPAIIDVNAPTVPVARMKTGDWILYPHSYLVRLDLQQGENVLTVNYSKLPKPMGRDNYRLAAFLSAINIKASR